jgi:hypothetical protein
MGKSLRTVLALIFILVGLAANSHVSAQVSPVSFDTVKREAEKGDYQLISMQELWKLYQQNNNLLLIDTRQEWEYQAGYIKGAVHFSMEPTWMARLTQRGPLQQFLGPDQNRNLVFY